MEIKKISENIYEIPKEGKMLVPGRIFASEKIMEDMKKDKTLEQVINLSQLPGILKASFAMPDAHQGYGFPIGGVAGFDIDKGIISPGGVGYDINCSIRLLKTNLYKKDMRGKEKIVLERLDKRIPSGLGRGSPFKITYKQLDELLEKGARYLVEKGFGFEEDLKKIEDNGCLKGDSSKVSERAKKRGIGQVGTLGAGNHFLEVQIVEDIFDEKNAKKFGLKKNQIVIMVHCGSRGLGHQVASDYIKLMEEKYGFKHLPDRELICAPIKSKLGKDYFSAMNCAANFAFANKQLITHWIREELKEIFPKSKIDVVYDVCHNIAKIEEFMMGGKRKKVCVHRKGATRSYKDQPVLIPGSMGTASYVLVGTKKAEEMTFGSTVHGAGRLKSRTKSIKENKSRDFQKELGEKGITVKKVGWKSLAEEAPDSYKDVDEVVRTVDDLGISKKVAKLKPFIVVKG